jgi:cell filamentation protein
MKKHGRYDASYLVEATFEPGSHGRVLKNLLGIKRKRDMDETESQSLKLAVDKMLGIYDESYQFTEADIRTMHKVWLGGIYEWAGSYRNVNLSKNKFPFAAAKLIPSLMKQFEKEFLQKHTPCTFKSLTRIVQSLAEVHTELILIHPFREGNGRLARLLSTIMASQAGLPILDFTDITGRKRSGYFSAIQSGLERDYKPMEKLFSKIIERSLKNIANEKV